MEAVIESFARKNNIIFGICDAERLTHIEPYLKKTDTPFVPKEIEKRINPKLILEDAQSIIVIGVNYNKKFMFKDDNMLRGNFSMGAVGEDYHITVKNILKKLAHELELYIIDDKIEDVGIAASKSQYKAKIFSDTGDLIERELALKAGLGVLGRNCNIISKKFGSMFNIGYIVTDMKIKVSNRNNPFEVGCYDCGKCVSSCPGKALSYVTVRCDFEKCVSYTTQKKGILSDCEIKNIGTQIYGCDICQIVCPHNKDVEGLKIYDIDTVKPKLEYLLTLTKAEFLEKYKKTSSGWRGKKLFKRNALIALGNIGSDDAVKIIVRYVNDNDQDISALAKRILENTIKNNK